MTLSPECCPGDLHPVAEFTCGLAGPLTELINISPDAHSFSERVPPTGIRERLQGGPQFAHACLGPGRYPRHIQTLPGTVTTRAVCLSVCMPTCDQTFM